MSWSKVANLRGPAGATGAGGTNAPANAVLLDTTQTVTGSKDFTGGLTINGSPVVATTDGRLSDQRTPSDGSVSLAKIVSGGLAPNAITGTAVVTGDLRLSNTRVPTDGSVTTAKIASGGLDPSVITGTAVVTGDTRLTNARTPTAHAASHASGGADALTLAESQVTNLVTDLAAKVDLASTQSISGAKTFTVSPTVPTPTASGHIAPKGYVDTAVANLVNAAPSTLDTLGEIAAALQADEGNAASLTALVATKAADNAVVHLTGAESIGGVKTFTAATNHTSLAASGTVLAAGVYDGASAVAGNRVYSPANPVPITGLSATGTASAASFLRGDGAWSLLSGITGLAPAAITGTAVITSDSRLSDTRTPTDGSVTSAKIVSGGLAPSAITGTAVITTDSRLSDTRVPTDGSVTLAKLSATGAPSATTFHRGDNTWSAVTVAAISATGTKDATTYLRGDGSWAAPTFSAPTNMVTTDTAQTISGVKTWVGSQQLFNTTVWFTTVGTPSAGSPTPNTNGLVFAGQYYSGGNVFNQNITLQYRGDLAQVYLQGSPFRADSIYDGANRVYSAGNLVPVAGITATGTPSATTYLRGDGAWAAVAAPSNMATVDTTQTITGAKTFSSALLATAGVYDGATAVAGNRVYSPANLVPVAGLSATGTKDATTYLRGDNTWAATSGITGLAPAAITGTAVITSDSRLSDQRTPLDGSVTLAKLSATGTPSSSTFHRGDNTWSTLTVGSISATGTASATTYLRGDGSWVALSSPVNMVTTDTQQVISGAKTFSAALLGTAGVYDGASAIAGNRVYSPANLVPVAGLSATGTRDATTYLRGDNTFALISAITGLAPSAITGTAVITTDTRLSDTRTPTDGTVTTAKIASGGLAPAAITGTAVITTDGRLSDTRTPTDGTVTLAKLSATGTASASTFLRGDNTWSLISGITGLAASAITGTAVITTDTRLSDTRTPTDGTVTSAKIASGGLAPTAITGTAVITTDSRLSDQRTPLDASVTVAKISATGTASATTFLRGDGTWSAPAAVAPSNMATTDTTQTITGAKTFSAALLGTAGVYDGATAVAGNRVYSPVNLVPVAGLSATGTKDATTFLRGDNTFALISGITGLAPAAITGTAVITTDTRLADTRTPTDGTVTTAKVASAGLAPTAITGTAVITTDSRLSDARTPTAHAATHGSAGSDPVTVALSQLGATGTRSSTTYLRGDGTWAIPATPPQLTQVQRTAQTVPSATDTIITFEINDSSSGVNVGSYITYSAGVFTALVAGLYSISATLRWPPGSTGERYTGIGSNVAATYNASRWAGQGNTFTSAVPLTQNVSTVRYLAAGTTFSVWGFQSNGNGQTFNTGFDSVRCAVAFLG